MFAAQIRASSMRRAPASVHCLLVLGLVEIVMKLEGADSADCAQMGGPEGVRASEHYTLVIGLGNGMSMHATPRPGVM